MIMVAEKAPKIKRLKVKGEMADLLPNKPNPFIQKSEKQEKQEKEDKKPQKEPPSNTGTD